MVKLRNCSQQAIVITVAEAQLLSTGGHATNPVCKLHGCVWILLHARNNIKALTYKEAGETF